MNLLKLSISKADAAIFQRRILTWYKKFGRHTLPWQLETEAYPIWLSEIMLQQTQVQTVIPYYHKFLSRFPTVQTLADASIDEVLGLWSGLGYYARGRNLHAAAQQVCQHHAGLFPKTLEALITLPGIGRSTAGAILAQSDGQAIPILDANVKRVLCRFHAIETASETALWGLATVYTPNTDVRAYTQAMMDIGALVCRNTHPECDSCPLQNDCAGFQSGNPTHYPEKKKRAAIPTRACVFALIIEGTRVLLQKRPTKGIWGGLWAFPEWSEATDKTLLGSYPHTLSPLQKHTFTHFHLSYQTRKITLKKCPAAVLTHWPNTELVDIIDSLSLGLPTPIKRLLTQLMTHSEKTKELL